MAFFFLLLLPPQLEFSTSERRGGSKFVLTCYGCKRFRRLRSGISSVVAEGFVSAQSLLLQPCEKNFLHLILSRS